MTLRRECFPHSALVPRTQRGVSSTVCCRAGAMWRRKLWLVGPGSVLRLSGTRDGGGRIPLREERDLLGLGHAADWRHGIVGGGAGLLQDAAGEDGGAKRSFRN